MNVPKLPSDFIGLSKVMPPLSRRGFMSNSAAAAAGYTLAAGPVHADAIQTDTRDLNAGMATIAVSGGNMPFYFARPANVANQSHKKSLAFFAPPAPERRIGFIRSAEYCD